MKVWWIGYVSAMGAALFGSDFSPGYPRLLAFVSISAFGYLAGIGQRRYEQAAQFDMISVPGENLSDVIHDMLIARGGNDEVFRMEFNDAQMEKIRDGLRAVGDVAA